MWFDERLLTELYLVGFIGPLVKFVGEVGIFKE